MKLTEEKENELKDSIIKVIFNYNHGYYPTRLLHELNGYKYSTIVVLIHQLIDESLIDYVNGQKDLITLTKAGKRAAEIGYSIYTNEVEEKSNRLIQEEEEKRQLELNSLRFNSKYKWMIIISFFISFLSLLIAFLTWYFPKQ